MAKKPTSKALTGDVIDVTSDIPELALVKSDVSAATSFFTGIAKFFAQAGDLEEAAKNRLVEARALVAPTTLDEDERIKTFVRSCSEERRAVETHWEVTALFSRFHKKLVAHRTRATEPLEEAARLGTVLHTRYKQEEERRAAAEQERLRLEAQFQARQALELELLELEAAALKAEDTSPDLSDRETRFVELYTGASFAANNGVTAARQAGFKNPDQSAVRLLSAPKVLAAIQAVRDAQTLRQQAEARRAAPVEVEVEEVKAQVSTKGDTTTWSGELLDEAAFINAVLEGKYGIPRDVLTVNRAKLNEYARSLHELLDRWPGVRAKKNTGIR